MTQDKSQDLTQDKSLKKIRLLFICLGNICRSPTAHAMMQHLVDEAGLTDRFFIDSAGIGGWHIGQLPDSRMRRHGARRGLCIDHPARQFDASRDFQRFDLIIVMDDDNYADITRQARNEEERKKVVRMAQYLKRYSGHDSVPDPYYGGEQGFELVLDLLEDACEQLLQHCITSRTE